MQANWQHALPAVAWLLAVAFWNSLDHCWSKKCQKLFHFYPMHIEKKPPRGHLGPGCMMSMDVSLKSWAVFRCQSWFKVTMVTSNWMPRILAAQHRASTSPSGGSSGTGAAVSHVSHEKRMALCCVLRCGSASTAWCDFGLETPVIPFGFGGFKMFWGCLFWGGCFSWLLKGQGWTCSGRYGEKTCIFFCHFGRHQVPNIH